MIKFKQFFWLTLLLLFFQSIYANTISISKLQTITHAFLKQHQREEYMSGLAVTVIMGRHGKPISAFAGTKAWDLPSPIDADSLFQIGSITKSYIAAMVLQFEAEGKLDLNAPIDTYFPMYPFWHEIKIKHLLTMTSGIPDYFQDEHIFTEYVKNPEREYSPSIWINHLYHHKPLLFKPGSRFYYSNTNYFLLGMIIERVTGKTLNEELENRLLNPLQLKQTYLVKHQLPFSRHLVHGYQFEQSFKQAFPLKTDITNYSLSYLGAAGGIVTTNEDMVKWIQALFTEGKVLMPSSYKKLTSYFISEKTAMPLMNSNKIKDQAYGFGVSSQYSANLHTRFYIYQGMTLGYRSLYVYIPAYQLFIAISVNSSFDGKENHLLSLVNQIGKLYQFMKIR